jgi:hypothetical protein
LTNAAAIPLKGVQYLTFDVKGYGGILDWHLFGFLSVFPVMGKMFKGLLPLTRQFSRNSLISRF